MQRKKQAARLVGVAVMAVFALAATAAHAQYNIQPITFPGGANYTTALGTNHGGTIAGSLSSGQGFRDPLADGSNCAPSARSGHSGIDVSNYALSTLCDSGPIRVSQPYGRLAISADGTTLYGCIISGGIYSIPITGGAPTILALFPTQNQYGSYEPNGGLTFAGGLLYGTTYYGGQNSGGSIFSFDPRTKAIAIVPLIGGSHPLGGLTLSGDTLYGTTSGGGTNYTGTVFSLNINTKALTTLASFAAGSGSPMASVTVSEDGATLYGTTAGTGDNNDGTVFSLPATGGTPTILARFDGANGQDPLARLTLAGDTLYGTTANGGVNDLGTLFSLPITGGAPTVLVNFAGTRGAGPSGDLTLVDGILYGTTINGGADDGGTAFSYDPSSNNFSVLANFSPASVGPGSDCGLTFSNGVFYGALPETTETNAVLYSLGPNRWTVKSIAVTTDGATRLLWTKPDGSVSVWTISSAGAISYSPTYGPYDGWTAQKIVAGAAGGYDIWWTTPTASASYWTVSQSGAVKYSPIYGPYHLWMPIDFSASADGSVRLLWTDGSTGSIWTISSSGKITYSPNLDTEANWDTSWSVSHIAAAPDGATRVLWDNSTDSASIWTVSADNTITRGPVYGPYDGWTCRNVAVMPSGVTRLQWNSGNATSFWTIDAAGKIGYSPVWGPFDTWIPTGFAAADGTTRLLWTSTTGQSSYWTVDANDRIVFSPIYGPY